jgi:TonB family protein
MRAGTLSTRPGRLEGVASSAEGSYRPTVAAQEGNTGNMPTHASRPPISDSFGLLPDPRGRLTSFTVSVTVNVVLGVLFIWVAIAQLHKTPPPPRYESTQLVFATPPPPPEPLPPVPHIKVPPPEPMAETPRKIELPKPAPEPPKPEPVHLNTPAMPVLPPAAPKAVVAPPQPKVGLFASPKTTTTANNMAAPTVQAGGFGNPAGATVNPNASRPSATPAVGSFNSAPGANQGAGAARQGVVQGVGFSTGVANGVPGGTSRGAVASAGFNNGVVGGTPGGSNSHGVATGGFGSPVGSGAPPAAKAQTVNFVAPEVLSEPKPQYTQEARELKIQGEVTLQVKFGADGKVEVLRVVSRLGHGLDEQAEHVAEQIRFKPAAKNGQPVDHITLIHILFQLA